MPSKLVKFNNHLTKEEIDLKKEEYMSIINEPTKKVLSGSFDLESHKHRGMNSRMLTDHNFTGKIYKDRIFVTDQDIDQKNDNEHYSINNNQYVTNNSFDNEYIVI
jgi:hypothetical protein